MANPWFRMYSEFAHDPKVQMMPEVMQRRYIMLMCMRCSNVTETLHVTEIAFHLRISDAELAETKALFLSKGFIDEDWNLLNWDKRQFTSDSSAARVSKHRAKQKEVCNADVTLQKRECNALDTDTDTEVKALSGKPDLKPQSIEILDYLNDKAVRSYKPVKSNLSLIASRLKEGATVDDCKLVIDSKCSKWRGDPKMEEYLRPKTLFGAENFAQYSGESGAGSSKPWEQ